jgi:anion-transporting  ArsA/GET3 family ATPase
MTDLLSRRLIFVTGKGGVGKTTVAAALALLAAQSGRRTLVCEVDAKGDLADFYETGPLRFEPRTVEEGLDAMAMQTEASLREYLRLQLRVPLLARIGPLARVFDFVALAAPGVREILTVGKLTWEVRSAHYDLVVVDGPATGHIVGQLASPGGIRQLVHFGMIRSQTDWMLHMLEDPATSGVVVVSAPEDMAVSETLELLDRLDQATRVDVAAVVMNRVLPELFSRGQQEMVERLDTSGSPPLQVLVDAARLATDLRRSRTPHLRRLRTELGHRAPLLYLPDLFTRVPGRRTTHLIAQALGAELGVVGAGDGT